MLNIEKSIDNGRVTLSLEGRLDTVTAPDLENELKESMEGATKLVLDFSALDYISSAGLRVLLYAEKQMSRQGEMKVTGVNSTIMEILDVTGFSDILTVE